MKHSFGRSTCSKDVQHARKYESTPSNARADEAAYRRALRAAKKEKQKAREAHGQPTIDKAFKRVKK